jgi:FtsH-binding integral membrane protein
MNNTFVYNPADKQTSARLISKVFAYMFGGVLLTTLVAIVVGLGFTQWLYGTLDVSSATTVNEEAYSAILTMLIISSIALIITTIVLNVFAFKGNHSLMIPALIYCVLMGLILSEFVIFLPWQILATAFGVTCLIFGAMSLIGLLSKGSLNILATIGIGLLVGSALISLVGMIFLLTGALGTYMNLYWIVSFASFAGMMFITIWDISHLKQMAESGSMNKNLILYLAFNLYVDFIYILMRVIYFVAMVYSRNK